MIVIGIILTVITGWVVIRTLKVSLSPYADLSLSFLFGIGIQTLLMFYLALLHIKLTILSVTLAVSLFILIVELVHIIVYREITRFSFSSLGDMVYRRPINYYRSLTVFEKVLLFLILALFAYSLIAGLYWPVGGWDAIALYDFRAKVFSVTGYMDDAISRGYFFGYPLMTSMAHTWVYLLGWKYPQFIYSFIYISLGTIFYTLVRQFTSRLNGLIFTLLLLISPPILANAAYAYTNLAYAVYFFLGTSFLIFWISTNDRKWLILASLAMGMNTWVRSTEPFWAANILVVLFMVYKRRQYLDLLYYLIPFLIFQQSWSLFQSHAVPYVGTSAQATQAVSVLKQGLDVRRLFQVLGFIYQNTAQILAPYFILAVLASFRLWKRLDYGKYLMVVVVLNLALLVVGAYLFTYIWQGWELIGGSLERMVIIFVPLFLLTAALSLDLKERLKSKEHINIGRD